MATFAYEGGILVIKFFKDLGDSEEFDLFERTFSEILGRCRHLKILFDLSDCEIAPITYILKHGYFMIKHDEYYKKNVKKTAILLPSDSWKNNLEYLFSFRQPSKPNIVSLNNADCINFLKAN
jgi:hypothetical protein